jgi:hypothetical protein
MEHKINVNTIVDLNEQTNAENTAELAVESISISRIRRIVEEKGFQSAEAQDIIMRYVDQVEAEAEMSVANSPQSPAVANRSRIIARVRIAKMYESVHSSMTNDMKEALLESLYEDHYASAQDESTTSDAEEIMSIIKRLTQNKGISTDK